MVYEHQTTFKKLGSDACLCHDAHTNISLGTAIYYQENGKSLKDNVKFLFQPAEESIGGAKRMMAEGCLENSKVDVVIGLCRF